MPKDSPTNTEAGAYRVLARRYRPACFDDLIGQEAMVRTLSNAFEMGRIAHAFMLTGVRGIGKTTTARLLARALNYESDSCDKPSLVWEGEGRHCADIMESRHMDVMEMDAASHTGIADVREIIDSLQYAPTSARYKVYIIDEVHMLSTAAFNGLLKTLEEPPGHVKFIFATTEIRKVPVTILSRCQRFDLRRLDAEDMTKLLEGVAGKEKITLSPGALSMLARAADGSARDALSLLDQAIAQGAEKVEEDVVRDMLGLADQMRVCDMFDALMEGKAKEAIDIGRGLYDVGAEPMAILADLADLAHWLTRLRLA
ncbi:MAG: DNA polymerase III subunit gamma/tau, partial [Hyphomicrobiales bacterium]|nr:DNA polymerase III subunit gamma/tau [Hyphomicrobiales bacterium]